MIRPPKDIIPPIDRALIEAELTPERFIRKTNNGSNLIYIVNNQNAPNTLREIGRLRELTFREAGGGTGLDCDLDELDLIEKGAYEQLIVWNAEDRQITGGYRFIHCGHATKDDHGHFNLATAHMFAYSDEFVRDYLPYTVELGRAWVQPAYQPGNSRKGLFSLDNIWDGLGAIVVDNPDVKYLMGKVTLYRDFNVQARDLILYYLDRYFRDPDGLMLPFDPIPVRNAPEFVTMFETNDLKEAFRILVRETRALGENVPPLINIYTNLTNTMRAFGTALNMEFGDVDESGIMITIADIFPEKKERHVTSYLGKANVSQ